MSEAVFRGFEAQLDLDAAAALHVAGPPAAEELAGGAGQGPAATESPLRGHAVPER
jgi:hypothetical protein